MANEREIYELVWSLIEMMNGHIEPVELRNITLANEAGEWDFALEGLAFFVEAGGFPAAAEAQAIVDRLDALMGTSYGKRFKR